MLFLYINVLVSGPLPSLLVTEVWADVNEAVAYFSALVSYDI